MDHRKLNKVIALIVFAIALAVYGSTVAPTTSYWDCGEFITCSYILGVPHPPGAPLYILVGRVFTMLPFFEDIGLRVNIISVLVSAFTVMLTYLIIVRLMREWRGIPETVEHKIVIYTSGIIGALGFAFSDSFWFNAVEAEVYAVSMFFTAIVVWLILVWLEKAENPVSDKILLLIAYLIGLAIGVHLLNVLALPTVFLIIYFKRAELNLKSFTLFGIGSLAAFGAIYPGMVKGIPWVMNKFSFAIFGALVFGILILTVYAIQNRKRVLGLALMGTMLVMIGYSTYTAIYIRSGLDPAIDENNPDVPKRFVSYVNREQYGDIPLTVRRAPLWEYQIRKMYIRYFGWQFIGKGNTLGPDNYIVEIISLRGLMGLPFLLGMIGMFYHFSRDWKKALSILTLFIMTGLILTIYLNQEDPQPRERDYAYVGSFFAFALWIGIGASAVLELVFNSIKRSAVLRKVGIVLTILLLILAVPFNLLSVNYHTHDRTGNYVAFDYSYNILQTCEPNAIIFTNGDNDTFPLWFLQYVYGLRKDVRVVNLSLLNTHWYIKQLRDEEPKVPINFTDEHIDQLAAIPWPEPRKIKIKVPREVVLEYLGKEEDNAAISIDDVPESPEIVFELRNTESIQGYPIIRVQDRMIVHILAANKFEKPVYFAVTVSPANMLGLDNRRGVKGLKNYLRMDGLAFKVMPYGGERDFISPQNLWTNLFEKFQYRNLNNPDVYLNNNIVGLLQNYRSAFLRLSNYYQIKSKTDATAKEKVIAALDKMNEVMPEEVVPLRNYQLSLNFGRMYYDVGRPDELEKRLDRIVKAETLGPMDKLYIAEYYSQYLRKGAKAESLAASVLEESPEFSQIYGWLVNYYTRSEQYDKGVETLQKWLARHPTDKNAQQQLASLQSLIRLEDSLKVKNEKGSDSSNDNRDEIP
ncbi:MAG: protein O-mannosyl-transferase family [bacterium]